MSQVKIGGQLRFEWIQLSMGDSLSEWKWQSSTVDFTRGSVQVKKKKKKVHASLSLINLQEENVLVS